LLLLSPAAIYGWAVLRMIRRGDRWPLARSLSALAGWAVLAASVLPPLADDFRLHIVQHLMLAMLAPLLLALSAPVTLALRTLPRRGRRVLLSLLHSRFARVVMLGPVVVALDAGGMYAYYLTPLFALAEQHPWLHLLVHGHMFVAGCLLSWYLVGRDPLPGRRSTRARAVMLLLAAAGHDVLAKLMYAHVLPAEAGPATQVRDGAQLLYYGGDAIELLLAIALFLAWYAETGRALRREQRRLGTI
jgi:putative membrane protein